MLLKTVHQWDISNQEDLAAFREESEAIHNGAIRTLYQKDPYADPGQRKGEEQDETVSDADLVSNTYPSREEFLARLARAPEPLRREQRG